MTAITLGAEPVPCCCGCGYEAVRPSRDKRFAETCYRRWLRLGRPDVLPPPDPAKRAAVLCRPPREPAGPPDEYSPAAQAARRVAVEASRADAYLRVRGGRDVLAKVRVRERVRDEGAFWALVGCKGARDKAAALLADLAGRERQVAA